MLEKSFKQTVLVVDDVSVNIDILSEVLGSEYVVKAARDGETALEIAVTEPQPDLVLLDIMMPGMDGYEVCRRLTIGERTRNIPVIFVTAKGDMEDEQMGLELGAVDYITKPVSPSIVKARVRNHLMLRKHQAHLEDLVRERTQEVEKTQAATITSMAVLAEYRDPETGGHIRRTQNYVKILAELLQDHPRYKAILTQQLIELLYKSAPLHDIGKVGVPDHILLKPGKLTVEEFTEMKKHCIYGRDTIIAAEVMLESSSSFLQYAKEIAETHHEKWDGTGYPQGLQGNAIPLTGRLMAIADVYDALISKRVYKPPFPHKKAVEIIGEGSGSHFDPEMVEAFWEREEDFRLVALQFADFEEERQALSL